MSEKLPESPEAIAYLLMKDIFETEQKVTKNPNVPLRRLTRKEILDTYSECLASVKQVDFQ